VGWTYVDICGPWNGRHLRHLSLHDSPNSLVFRNIELPVRVVLSVIGSLRLGILVRLSESVFYVALPRATVKLSTIGRLRVFCGGDATSHRAAIASFLWC